MNAKEAKAEAKRQAGRELKNVDDVYSMVTHVETAAYEVINNNISLENMMGNMNTAETCLKLIMNFMKKMNDEEIDYDEKTNIKHRVNIMKKTVNAAKMQLPAKLLNMAETAAGHAKKMANQANEAAEAANNAMNRFTVARTARNEQGEDKALIS